jgi:hypothetical protein
LFPFPSLPFSFLISPPLVLQSHIPR